MYYEMVVITARKSSMTSSIPNLRLRKQSTPHVKHGFRRSAFLSLGKWVYVGEPTLPCPEEVISGELGDDSWFPKLLLLRNHESSQKCIKRGKNNLPQEKTQYKNNYLKCLLLVLCEGYL